MLDVDPPLLEHAAFGRLLWDDDVQWYRGRMGLQGEVVDLSISPFTDWVPSEIPTRLAEPQHLIDAVLERLALVQPRIHDLKLYAAASLLESHNGDGWNEGDPIDAATFASRLRLTSVDVHESLRAEWWFDDGDLFWGHSVMVETDEAGHPHDAGLHG